MAKKRAANQVHGELIVSNAELVDVLSKKFDIPHGVALSGHFCDVVNGEIASHSGPRIDLTRHGLVIQWTETS